MLGENYCMYFLLLYYSNIWLSKHFIFTNTIHMNNITFEGLGILFTFGFNNILVVFIVEKNFPAFFYNLK